MDALKVPPERRRSDADFDAGRGDRRVERRRTTGDLRAKYAAKARPVPRRVRAPPRLEDRGQRRDVLLWLVAPGGDDVAFVEKLLQLGIVTVPGSYPRPGRRRLRALRAGAHARTIPAKRSRAWRLEAGGPHTRSNAGAKPSKKAGRATPARRLPALRRRVEHHGRAGRRATCASRPPAAPAVSG